MKIWEFWTEVNRYHSMYPHMRKGQAAFNVLWSEKRTLAEKIRGTEVDPFYAADDSKEFEAFVSYLGVVWEDL